MTAREQQVAHDQQEHAEGAPVRDQRIGRQPEVPESIHVGMHDGWNPETVQQVLEPIDEQTQQDHVGDHREDHSAPLAWTQRPG